MGTISSVGNLKLGEGAKNSFDLDGFDPDRGFVLCSSLMFLQVAEPGKAVEVL